MRIYYCRDAHRVFFDEKGYRFERGRTNCPLCLRIAGLDSSPAAHIENRNVQMTDRERKDLSTPFGKSRAKNFRSARDVDKALNEFQKKYPHFGGSPGPASDMKSNKEN